MEVIFKQALAVGKATFQKVCPAYEEFDRNHHKLCRLVLEKDGKVIGYTVISPYSFRPAYRGVAELSIYLDGSVHRKGYGLTLLNALIAESEKEGFWTLQAGILAVNQPSLSLHEKAGFRQVGRRERIAQDIWGDWQDVLLYERRSPRF